MDRKTKESPGKEYTRQYESSHLPSYSYTQGQYMSPQPGSSQHQQYAYPYGAYPYQPTATPFYPAQQPVMVNTQTPQAPPPKQIMVQHRNVSPLAYKLSQQLPTPPFSRLEPSEESLRQQPTKRMKRKSKFTKEQDDLIIELKKAGKSWVEIAEQANTGTYLAARNRYQVLIGQQGGGSSDCGPEDVMELRHVADQGEMEKIRYLVREFEKNTGKAVDQKQIREFLRYLFWKDPTFFDVDETYLAELLQIQASR